MKQVSSLGLLCKVQSREVVQLLDVLLNHISVSEGICVCIEDESKRDVVQFIRSGLRAVHLSLVLLGAENMPVEVYREDFIDRIVHFIKFQATHNLLPISVTSNNQPGQISAGMEQGQTSNSSASTIKDKRRQKKSKTTTKHVSWGGAVEGASFSRNAFTVDHILSAILVELANLVFVVHVSDAAALRMSSLGFSLLLLNDTDFLQAKAIEVIVSVFTQYPGHRREILDNILVMILKLPQPEHGSRRYKLLDDDSHSLHIMNALFMRCIQASVTFDSVKTPCFSHVKAKRLEENRTVECESAFHWSHYFWKQLLKSWHTARLQEVDVKAVIQNTVTDLLVTLNMPEWPESSLILLSLCTQLLSSSGLHSMEMRQRETAVEIIGQIAMRVKRDANDCECDVLSRLIADTDDYHKLFDMAGVAKAADIAMRDADHARSKAGALTRSSHEIVTDNMLVLETIILQYVFFTSLHTCFPGQREPAAFTFLLALLTREDECRGVGFRSQSNGPGGTRASYREIRSLVQTRFSSGATYERSIIPRSFAIRIFRVLRRQQPLAQQLDILVSRIVKSFNDPAISVRAAAVRAIDGMVSVDPQILILDDVRMAIKRSITDNGTLVRSATIELVGNYVTRHPQRADEYYAVILERISDVGVSVRRRVVQILHGLLHEKPNHIDQVQILRFLAFRILDDDPGVQELVVCIFRELWFLPPLIRGGGGYESQISSRAEQLVDVLWDIFLRVGRTGLALLPLLPSFPLVAILRRVIFMPRDEFGALDGNRTMFKSNDMVSMARQLCLATLQGLLLHEEDTDECNPIPLHGSISLLNIRSGLLEYPRKVRFSLGMHLFCATDTSLCVVEDDQMALAHALHPYIKRRDNNATNSLHLQCCISVIDAVMRETIHLKPSVIAEIEKDLRILLLRNTYHGVLYYAARCMCSIANPMKTPFGASGALQVTRQFVKLLDDVCNVEELSLGQSAHVSRAMFVLGHLAKFGADVLERSGEETVSLSNILRLFRCFLQRSSKVEFSLKKSALQACGLLFVARPLLMLSPKGGFGKGSVDGIMRAALSSTAERGLKEQALLNLAEFLREEEARFLKQTTVDSSTSKREISNTYFQQGASYGMVPSAFKSCGVQVTAPNVKMHEYCRDNNFQAINGEHDNSLANGVAQRYWSDVKELCIDPEPLVRVKALHVAEIVLRQGLVHPMSSFPPLLALQADPGRNIRKLAMCLLRQQHDRYSDFFYHQLNESFALLYTFCARLHFVSRQSNKQKVFNEVNDVLVSICLVFGSLNCPAVLLRTKRFPEASVQNFFFEIAFTYQKHMTCSRISCCIFILQTPDAADITRAFTLIYKLVSAKRSTRLKFLRALIRPFEDKATGPGSTGSMFVCFIASAIAALPFSMSDEVLFVTYHLNRIISLCDWPTPESLLEKCEQIENTGVKGTSSSHIQNELCRNVELCMHVSIFLKLKHHLKGVYGLADNRMRSYSPSEPPKSGDSFRYDGTFGQLDLSWVDNSLGDTVDGVRRQVELFRSLLQSDSNDYAECLSNDACREHESRKRGRGF